jgi:hypothetical protein
VSEGKPLGTGGNTFNRVIDLGLELLAKPPLPGLASEHRFVELSARGAPKDDLHGHRFKRATIDALTSSHDTTSSGWASCSASRRSSSTDRYRGT